MKNSEFFKKCGKYLIFTFPFGKIIVKYFKRGKNFDKHEF